MISNLMMKSEGRCTKEREKFKMGTEKLNFVLAIVIRYQLTLDKTLRTLRTLSHPFSARTNALFLLNLTQTSFSEKSFNRVF